MQYILLLYNLYIKGKKEFKTYTIDYTVKCQDEEKAVKALEKVVQRGIEMSLVTISKELQSR